MKKCLVLLGGSFGRKNARPRVCESNILASPLPLSAKSSNKFIRAAEL